MILGLVQMHIAWEDKETNKKIVEKYIAEFSRAVSGNTETALLLFPEMSFTGFSMNVEKTADKEMESIRFSVEMADKYNISIGFGWVKKGEELCENHYSIALPKKGIVSDYIKIHPFSFGGEDKYFKGGENLSVSQIGDFCIGTAICYDLRFPEIFQIMSETAELIIVPANWPEKRRKHWNILLSARAIENQCYIAGINCVGNIGDIVYSGDTALYTPAGEEKEPLNVISCMETVGEESKIYVYKIENNVEEIRRDFPAKEDRRDDLYCILRKS